MNQYHVKNIYEKCKEITVQVPGSKSITNRALHIAALAKGESILDEVLLSDDALVFVECLQRLGIDVIVNKADLTIKVKG
ncbi:MAG: 3-phosphoshikimate 1-carboxyvinyltransferase, partial [Ruminococcus sp.]|nr:3-phosphoshikimate 1-carboxyvinyltransferase [Ruminococcus sp.]